MCLVTVQLADGEIRLLASGTSPSGGTDVYLYIERDIYIRIDIDMGPSCPKRSRRIALPRHEHLSVIVQ